MDAVNSLVFAVIKESLPAPQSPVGFCLTMADRSPPLPYNPHRHGVEAWLIMRQALDTAAYFRRLMLASRAAWEGGFMASGAMHESRALHFGQMEMDMARSLALRCMADDLSWEQSGGLG